ncbi:hypothetical protein PFISCL1PPCAC_20698 [Pristionchus fissidentatus]|uniref:Uncharacterized protein n=1 Tax=Pristionchus fissidentatus TaxID=1538716 RepID=A0AAV5WAW1_9BILA|nr:hypothetical protein PFISCL1PPCAC_20698 [Pristionchus fissidentatus]
MCRFCLVSLLVVVGLAGVAHSADPLKCDTLAETPITDKINKTALPGGVVGTQSALISNACAKETEWCAVEVKKDGEMFKFSKKCVPAPEGTVTGTVCIATTTTHTCMCKTENCNHKLDDIYKTPTEAAKVATNKADIASLEKLGVAFCEIEQKFYILDPSSAGSLSLLTSIFFMAVRQFI